MFVSYFLIVSTCMVLLNTHLAYGKRGCASFGHSCFGGHGKRSVNNKEIAPFELLNENANRHRIPLKHDYILSPERSPSSYAVPMNRDATEVISLLKKMVRYFADKQRLNKNQRPEYHSPLSLIQLG